MRLIRVLQDERGFVHKRLLGIGKGIVGTVAGTALSVIPGGGVARGILERFIPGIIGGGSRLRPPPQFTQTDLVPIPMRSRASFTLPSGGTATLAEVTAFHRATGVQRGLPGQDFLDRLRGITTGNGRCEDPRLEWDPVKQFCRLPGSPEGGVGEAVMGQFGAALEPSFMTINQRVCLSGMVLGKDFLCYNKGSISNKQRLWPKGTAPLLTGGEMNAIRKAASAAKKFQRTGQRFKSLGFFKTPSRRAPKRIAAGRTVKVLESGPGSVQL